MIEPMKAEEIVQLLRQRFAAPAWAFLEQVGDATGFATSRHVDGLAMGLWPSRGLEIIGFEVKVSRSDWKRELLKPDKAEVVASRCDRWYVVAPKGICDPQIGLGVPDGWGLMEVQGKRLVTVKEAPRHEAKPLDRTFLAAILRQASAQSPTKLMRLQAQREARSEAQRDVDARVASRTLHLQAELDALRTRVSEFEATTGIPLEQHQGSPSYYYGFLSGEALGKAVLYLAGDGRRKVESQLRAIRHASQQLRELADATADAVGVSEEEQVGTW